MSASLRATLGIARKSTYSRSRACSLACRHWRTCGVCACTAGWSMMDSKAVANGTRRVTGERIMGRRVSNRGGSAGGERSGGSGREWSRRKTPDASGGNAHVQRSSTGERSDGRGSSARTGRRLDERIARNPGRAPRKRGRRLRNPREGCAPAGPRHRRACTREKEMRRTMVSAGGSAPLATVVSLPTARAARPGAQRRGTPKEEVRECGSALVRE